MHVQIVWVLLDIKGVGWGEGRTYRCERQRREESFVLTNIRDAVTHHLDYRLYSLQYPVLFSYLEHTSIAKCRNNTENLYTVRL